jgi:hypothetical protein
LQILRLGDLGRHDLLRRRVHLASGGTLRIGVAAGLFSAGIEFSQLWHTDVFDAFRRTTTGVLLIGRLFSSWDILSYSIGIAALGLFDIFVSRPEVTAKP